MPVPHWHKIAHLILIKVKSQLSETRLFITLLQDHSVLKMFFKCYLQFGFHDILKELIFFIACLTQVNYTAVAICRMDDHKHRIHAIAAEQLDLVYLYLTWGVNMAARSNQGCHPHQEALKQHFWELQPCTCFFSRNLRAQRGIAGGKLY